MAGTPSTANVYIGAPDRLTSGAILVAPVGTAMPTTLAAAPDALFKDLGYISEDGLSIAQASTWETVKDWGGDQIRKFLSDFTGTLSFTMNEVRSDVLKFVYGSANVAITAPTVSTGTLHTVKLNSTEPDRASLVANILDGPRKIRITATLCQVTERQDLTFNRTAPIQHGVTVETYPDATGNSILIYTDDGVFSA